MIISCTACGTNFRLKAQLLKTTGTTVRCSKCEHVFTAYPPQSEGIPDEGRSKAAPGRRSPDTLASGSMESGQGRDSGIIDFGDIEDTTLETIGFEDLSVEQDLISLRSLETEGETLGVETRSTPEQQFVTEIDLENLTGTAARENEENIDADIFRDTSKEEFDSLNDAADNDLYLATTEPDLELSEKSEVDLSFSEVSMASLGETGSGETEIELSDLMTTASEVDLDDLEETTVDSREDDVGAETSISTSEPESQTDGEMTEVYFTEIGFDPTNEEFSDDEKVDFNNIVIEEDKGIDLKDLQETVLEPEFEDDEQLDDIRLDSDSDLINDSKAAEDEKVSEEIDDVSDLFIEEDTDFSLEDAAENKKSGQGNQFKEEEFDLGLSTEESLEEYSTTEDDEFDDLNFDELEKELDFDLDELTPGGTEEEPAGENVKTSNPEEEFELDPEELSEEGLGLDFDPEDFDLDLEETPGDASKAVDPADSEDEENFELDLSLDPDNDTEKETARGEEDGTGQVGEEFELDLQDDEQPVAEEDDFDFELNLQEDDDEEDAGSKAAEEEFVLDFDLEPAPSSSESATSEPTGMQSEGDTEISTEMFDEDFSLDLDLEPEEEDVSRADQAKKEPHTEQAEEFDLSDVEDFLDLEDKTETEAGTTQAVEDEDFDLTLETEAGETYAHSDEEGKFDIDLETVVDDDTAHDTMTEGQTEKELSMETESVEGHEHKIDKANFASPVTESTQIDIEPVRDEQDYDEGYEEDDEEFLMPTARRPRRRPILRILLLLLLLAAAGAGAYYYYFNEPAVPDVSGNLEIEVSTPAYEFIKNEAAGELLVVTGNVTNRYDSPRRHIQVKGNLYDADGRLLKTSTAFAGNTFEPDALKTQDFASIQKQLTNRQGVNNLNREVKPGEKIPFTVVFSDLPVKVEELAVEVTASEGI